jgi:hypothetical protein
VKNIKCLKKSLVNDQRLIQTLKCFCNSDGFIKTKREINQIDVTELEITHFEVRKLAGAS